VFGDTLKISKLRNHAIFLRYFIKTLKFHSMKDIYIGKLIKEKFEEKKMSKAEFAQ
jgi:hypothetical protein